MREAPHRGKSYEHCTDREGRRGLAAAGRGPVAARQPDRPELPERRTDFGVCRTGGAGGSGAADPAAVSILIKRVRKLSLFVLKMRNGLMS